MMRKYMGGAALLLSSAVAVAAPAIGDMMVLSAPSQPFKAEISIAIEKGVDLTQLRAGVLSRQARAGGKQQAWEKDATYRLEDRGNGYMLVMESPKVIPDRTIEITVGVEDDTGKATRDYVFERSAQGWATPEDRAKHNTPMASVKVPHLMGSVAAQDDEAQPLKLSTDLHFVVPFADGQVRLGPKGREALDRLAEVAVKAERIQIKGWAGSKDESARESMAFNRAYTVRYQLAKRGVDKDALRIMKPELALAELDAEGVKTPQVVASLLVNEPEKAAAAEQAK